MSSPPPIYANPRLRRILLIAGPLLLIAGGLYFYFQDPYSDKGFLACPIKFATGYDCPGCGGQRASHHLVHLRIGEALRENWLFVLGLPYILLGLTVEYILPIGSRRTWFRTYIFGRVAIFTALFLIIGWWILRNLI